MKTDKKHIYSIKCIAIVISAVIALVASSILFANQANADETASVASDSTKCQAMYRLYNKWTGEHFYTADKDEQKN